ncbi:MAG: heme-binding protein [Terriglobales bacterium]|jgi:hypothetical protein
MSNIPSVRLATSNDEVFHDLGLLADLAGTWHGKGFNLIARPDKEGNAPLFLELNQTSETLRFDPIASSIPNRGNAQDDIELFGLTYLQKISDAVTGGALHIEPGIWISVPQTTAPSETASVARMASIPHGNALLAQGTAISVNPLPGGTFAIDPVNTAPFPQGAAMPAGGTQGGFPEYDLSNTTPAATNSRTPFGDTPPVALPAAINGVPMQTVVNDPTRLLQQAIQGQNIEEMVVLQIATVASLNFQANPKPVTNGGGGIENIAFLETNADTALVFATFWIEKIKHPAHHFMQLQYVQTVLLNFPLLPPGKPPVPFSWPHVSVATLRKTFGGQ